jgi:hypothetical protein
MELWPVEAHRARGWQIWRRFDRQAQQTVITTLAKMIVNRVNLKPTDSDQENRDE